MVIFAGCDVGRQDVVEAAAGGRETGWGEAVEDLCDGFGSGRVVIFSISSFTTKVAGDSWNDIVFEGRD